MFSLLLGLAQAQDSPPVSQDTEEQPIYVMARGGLAVPFAGSGDIPAASVGVGLYLGDGQSLGLRAMYMHDLPSGTRAGSAPPPWAWGPMVDYEMRLSPERRRSAYIHLSAGFVYGTTEGGRNVVVPLGEAGMGLHFAKDLSPDRQLYISPELGVVPSFFNQDGTMISIEAPYAALTVGVLTR